MFCKYGQIKFVNCLKIRILSTIFIIIILRLHQRHTTAKWKFWINKLLKCMQCKHMIYQYACILPAGDTAAIIIVAELPPRDS